MAKVRDQGDLYITTIKDLLDYWCFIEKISFKYFPNGEVHVYNNNNVKVKGLSISVKAKKVQVIKETSKTRLIKDDIVMWFDINAKDYVVLKIN